MKKTTIAVALSMLVLTGGTLNAQKLKDKVAGKITGGGGSGAFAELNAETDEMGITGQYYGLIDKVPVGMKFVKEADGKIVNQIYFYEKKMTPEPLGKLNLKESYYTKNQVKLFYLWTTSSASGYMELLELETGVFAVIAQTNQSVQDGPATLDADRKVRDVIIKDQAKLSTWDLEAAQAKVDVIINSLNVEKLEKEKAKWMKNEIYSKNVDKIVFSNQWYNLQKHGYPHEIAVDGKNFKTELDMAGNMNYMAFFSFPPNVKYAGQQINIEYEMGGIKMNREELRKKSAAWSNMVKILETKDFEYNQSSVRAIREFNQYNSQYIQDYAAINVLYSNKDKFKVDGTYPLTIRMYAHRDGENGALLAEGTVILKYTKEAKLIFEGNPDKPEVKGVWDQFEDFLDE
jgi:hypothetical protein